MAREAGSGPNYRVVPFDKNGTCTSPMTFEYCVKAAADATDVFLFCHGWNNDWAAATGRYDEFIDRYQAARASGWSPPDRDYRSLPIGVFWPSAVLVAPWERAPRLAGAVAPDVLAPDVLALGDALPPERVARFYELADRARLDPAGAAELAQLLCPVVGGHTDELGAAGTSVEDLLAVWSAVGSAETPRATSEAGGFVDDDDAGVDPEVAGLGWLDPRGLVRVATVLLMKDRAGRVGARGVAELLEALCAVPGRPRIHLIGHSYGAKVVLSALCGRPDGAVHVDSVLLLQPAVSCYCFADNVPGSGQPGGYHAAPARSREPILTTFSRHDVPLTRLFHWAVRRASDLGEAVIAGLPPSRYAALGGYGPQGRDAQTRVIAPVMPPELYPLATSSARIVAIQADDVIGGHGDVTNSATAWALLSQVRS
jgi:pimeloyl-ACP methyl ester carboxylesterase